MYFPTIFLLASLSFVSAAPSGSCTLKPASNVALPSSTPASGSGTTAENGTYVSAAWFPGWNTATFPVSKIPWAKYSQVTYSFAITTPDVTALSLADSDEPSVSTFVSDAHDNNVHALVSIGGWTGSQYFSTNVGNAANRTAFVKTVLALASKYDLDGLDFDWEYPNSQGIGCNQISTSDSANFLSFLQELRQDPAGQKLILTAATSITPFAGSDGTPMADVSEFAKVLDYVGIMNYDINGQWSTTGVGPNAPLDDACSTVKAGSATSAIAAWTGAKFPAKQLLLGVAAYGHSFTVDPTVAVVSGALASFPAFIKNITTDGVDQCGNPAGADDDLNFVDLVTQGYLTANGTAADGMTYRFDNCSQTPYIYNENTKLMVSYDDSTSFAAKGKFILDNGLAGFSMWDATGDSDNILLDSINGALGLADDSTDC